MVVYIKAGGSRAQGQPGLLETINRRGSPVLSTLHRQGHIILSLNSLSEAQPRADLGSQRHKLLVGSHSHPVFEALTFNLSVCFGQGAELGG